MNTTEPDLARGECILQKAVVTECHRILAAAGVSHILLKGFGLDVAIWALRGASVKVKFLEIKVFTGARQGGVGFGNGQGRGPQVDLLVQEQSKLALLDRSVRWILGDATSPAGSLVM